jgi:hypothetical protein
MAAVAKLGANYPFGAVFPGMPGTVIRQYRLAVAIAAGDAVARNAAGLAVLADPGGAATAQFRGIALGSGNAGDTISVLEEGEIYGFNLAGLNADAPVYIAAAGALQDAAGAIGTIVGRVAVLTDYPTMTKVLKVKADPSRVWA